MEQLTAAPNANPPVVGNSASSVSSPTDLWSLDNLKQAITQIAGKGDVIEGIIPAASVNLAVGESGIGKSPLLYDMAIRVAAGLPFLGCEVQRGPALVLDFENSGERVQLCETLLHTAGLKQAPPEFWIDPAPGENFIEKISDHKPALVLIDSLKMFRPDALKGDGVDALRMLKELEAMARSFGTAFILIHHLRKEDRRLKLPDLESTPVLEWLQEAAGTRSFINQTDARLAIAERKRHDPKDGREILVLRHFIKLRGEYGPMYAERIFQGSEPVGYKRISDLSLLSSEYQELYQRLPATFRHHEAESLCGRSGGALAYFLRKCLGAGVLRKDQSAYIKCSRR
jgi:hypothetical protein